MLATRILSWIIVCSVHSVLSIRRYFKGTQRIDYSEAPLYATSMNIYESPGDVEKAVGSVTSMPESFGSE